MYIHGDDITNVEFKALQLYNFLKNDRNTRKICRRPFLHKSNTNIEIRGEILCLDPL